LRSLPTRGGDHSRCDRVIGSGTVKTPLPRRASESGGGPVILFGTLLLFRGALPIVEIFHVAGRRLLHVKVEVSGREFSFVWDRRGMEGMPVASGVYFARLQAGGIQSCRSSSFSDEQLAPAAFSSWTGNSKAALEKTGGHARKAFEPLRRSRLKR